MIRWITTNRILGPVVIVGPAYPAKTRMGDSATGAGEIIGREEGPRRLDFRMHEPELVESLHRQVVGQTGAEVQCRDRFEHIPQLGPCDPHFRDIHRVDGTQAVAQENTFPPVDHLVAGPEWKPVFHPNQNDR